ncbi:unnamed protein product, partial [Urochloa humidicola]
TLIRFRLPPPPSLSRLSRLLSAPLSPTATHQTLATAAALSHRRTPSPSTTECGAHHPQPSRIASSSTPISRVTVRLLLSDLDEKEVVMGEVEADAVEQEAAAVAAGSSGPP